MTKLSEAAESALISAHGRQGAAPTIGGREEFTELRSADLVGREGGLTRKGVIARDRIVKAREDEAFG